MACFAPTQEPKLLPLELKFTFSSFPACRDALCAHRCLLKTLVMLGTWWACLWEACFPHAQLLRQGEEKLFKCTDLFIFLFFSSLKTLVWLSFGITFVARKTGTALIIWIVESGKSKEQIKRGGNINENLYSLVSIFNSSWRKSKRRISCT